MTIFRSISSFVQSLTVSIRHRKYRRRGGDPHEVKSEGERGRVGPEVSNITTTPPELAVSRALPNADNLKTSLSSSAMSAGLPEPEVYFADDFEPSSLKVAQLRSVGDSPIRLALVPRELELILTLLPFLSFPFLSLHSIRRGILLQHSRALPSNAKKQELVNAFVDTVLPLKQSVLRARKNVKSSGAGIQIMGEPNLDEPVVSTSDALRDSRGQSKERTRELTRTLSGGGGC